MQTLFDKIFRNQDGKIVVWQMPNLPLWSWIVSVVIGFIVRGQLKMVVSAIGSLALVVWAVMEIAKGESLFRRIVGGLVLLMIITSVLTKLRR